jgi:hypothetical protein
VECLVDFSVSNLNWVREEDLAMENRRAAAEQAKLANPEFDDRYMDMVHDQDRDGIAYSPVNDNGELAAHMNGASGSGILRALDDTFNDSSLYPEPDPNAEIPRLGKRNHEKEKEDDEENATRRKRKKKQKKNWDEPPQRLEPKSTSGKQYQKEVQRKLLEEAKRKDRFILVAARMKGKSRIVKLPMDPELLESIQRRPVLERPVASQERESSEEPEVAAGNILQSDIMASKKPAVTPAQKEKAQKTFRVRINDDETYSTRKRNPEASLPGKPGRPRQGRSRFEEITVDSEVEADDIVTGYGGPGAGRSTGRTSNWLARKNEGEEDLPTELPIDFRDGLANPNRDKKIERNRVRNQQLAEQRNSMSSRPTTKPRSPGADRPRKSTSTLVNGIDADDEGRDGFGENDDTGEALLLAQSAAAALTAQRQTESDKARAAAAEKAAQENLRAKMGIEEEYLDSSGEEDLNGFIDTLAAEDEPLVHERSAEPSSSPAPNGAPLQSNNSIFLRPGMEGKKIKIVSKRSGDGASKTTTTTTTTVTTPVSGFTAVNKKVSKSINVSDSESDSEDEIPATAPAPKKPVGRPRGRPSLVPTRGASSGRGRGRPRGRPRKSG